MRPIGLMGASDDHSGALAVPDTEPLWLAVHQVIDGVENACQLGARQQVADERMCVNSLGMADGAALVRKELIERRDTALKLVKGK